jgi:hypothetical protein
LPALPQEHHQLHPHLQRLHQASREGEEVNRLTDGELALLIEREIDEGGNYTQLCYQLRADGYAISEKRLRRLWEQAGGYIRPRSNLYAPGTGPFGSY